MSNHYYDLRLAQFSERLALNGLKSAEAVARFEVRVDAFVGRIQAIEPSFRESFIGIDDRSRAADTRTQHLERRVANLELHVAAPRNNGEVEGRITALEQDLARVHARIDSLSGDMPQRLQALGQRIVALEHLVRLQPALPQSG
jgi:uncharacterized coiled-coil protein SlyX